VEKADRILYVTDAGQSQHFEMVFKVAKLAGYVPDHVSLEHVPFGLVQGEDGKKFATRSGDTVKLKDLLSTAVERAGKDLGERGGSIDNAKLVGMAAVKYADLSMNRESNYRFSYDRMLSLNGNTAPYMLYAYARICGIIRKSGDIDSAGTSSKVILSDPTEIDLARALVKLPDLLHSVENDLYPSRICDYLFDTSQRFNQFYERCSVNNAESVELKASRLTLCNATASTLQLLLSLLGIPITERL
jgi:arginyl-tRNA synthetase